MQAVILALGLASCGLELGGSEEAAAPAAPAEVVLPPTTVRLLDLRHVAEVELPDNNLPPGFTPGVAHVRTPFEKLRTTSKVTVWRTPLPFDVGLILDDADAPLPGRAAPDGMVVTGPQGRLPFSTEDRPGTWSWTASDLLLRTARKADAPSHRAYKAALPALAAVERRRSPSLSGDDPLAFAFGRRRGADGAWEGVFLPAPATATWSVDIAPDMVFETEARLLPPFVAGAGSDGADLVLEVVTDAGVVEVARASADREGVVLRAPMARFAGRDVRLRLRSDPRLTRYHDHVLAVDPVLVRGANAPRHVVMVSLGAVRADVLDPDDRQVLPSLDGLAAEGRTFLAARAPSPDPATSLGTALSGDWPGRADATYLPLDVPGSTAAVLGTAARGPGLGQDAGWMRVDRRAGEAPADTARRALHVLSQHAARDLVLFVRFHGAAPPWNRVDPTQRVSASSARAAMFRALGPVDHALGDLLGGLRSDTFVVVFGEAGVGLPGDPDPGVGAGVDDTVVQVPLVVSGPGVVTDRAWAPASLADVATTVRLALDLPDEGPGVDLRTWGSDAAHDTQTRALPLGWTARGPIAWGVWTPHGRWASSDGVVEVWGDADPGPLRARLEQVLGTAVNDAWTLRLDAVDTGVRTRLVVSHASGLYAAWPSGDGTEPALADAVLTLDGEPARWPRAVHVVPRDLGDRRLKVTVEIDGEVEEVELTLPTDGPERVAHDDGPVAMVLTADAVPHP